MSRMPVLVSLIVFAPLAGCATVDPFEQVLRIDAELVEGSSTKADVLELLGEPDGTGGALLPPDFESQEMWYYFEQTTSNARIENDVLKADATVEWIGIFFSADRFDGYWFTGSGMQSGEFPLEELGIPPRRGAP